jgi:hypothetical protein
MSRLERVDISARVYPPGSVVYFATDRAVRRGRVLRVEASLEAGADVEVPRVEVTVRYLDSHLDPVMLTLPQDFVHDSPILASNDAFGHAPEPAL